MNTKNLGDKLNIGGKTFISRLMLGTGKYKNIEDAKNSINISECEIVTVAIRRAQNNKLQGNQTITDVLNWKKLWLLPNTAGCETAEEAIRIAQLGREIVKYLGQEENNFIKLEVICDPKYLLPDPIGTLKAAEYLIHKGFTVLPYINADVSLAKQLESLGCATVMPLASPIGSGKGLENLYNIQMIIDSIQIPVIIDAGIGTPSEACQAMEIGADGVLMNTAIAKATDSTRMAKAMKYGIEAGRNAFIAGRMEINSSGSKSSPQINISK
uniref:Thiazole synthase n=1 Tax=Rhodochaete parvula TaxID=110510 RepID=A0A1X9PV28_9RHOD|nr:thiazole biosynthesis protein ThiG [Rhodochaete parvula]